MKILFTIEPSKYAEYCISCHQESSTKQVEVDATKLFVCSVCGAQNERQLIIDPKLRWWLDDTQTYCHESVGILLVNKAKQILMFELTKFPYGYTVPAGHVDLGESARDAVIREAKEEVGIGLDNPILVAETLIHGDSCRRGSDDHKWSLFLQKVQDEIAANIVVDHKEGTRPVWVNMNVILSSKVPYAMSFLFNEYGSKIEALVNEA